MQIGQPRPEGAFPKAREKCPGDEVANCFPNSYPVDSAIQLLNKVSLGIENADSPDDMNSNWKVDALLDGTLNFVFTNLSSEST